MDGCYTDFEEFTTEFKWTIRKFDKYFDAYSVDSSNNQKYSSKLFYTGTANERRSWQLQLYLTGNNDENKDWLSIGLHWYSSRTGITIGARWKYFILNAKREKIADDYCEALFSSSSFLTYITTKFYKRESLLSNAGEFLPNNQLTIICELTTREAPVTKVGYSPIRVAESHMSKDFEKLFEVEGHGDVTLMVEETEFKVYKCILIARSPVFAAMFKYSTQEQQKNHVDIPDVRPEVFEELLRYIYTDNVMHLDEIADELLAAADKYELNRLKEMCEVALYDQINIKNAAQIYDLAERHNVEQLKNCVVAFIAANKVKVMETIAFKKLQKLHMTKLYETLLK